MKIFRFSIIILIFGCFCLLFSHHLNAKPAMALKLRVFFDKNEYKTGEPIYINFKLKNIGNEPVYVNKRFYVNSEEARQEDREVYLQVIGPSGQKLSFKGLYDTGFPKTDYFVLLKPEEEITSERKKNLKAYFDLKAPGKYKVIAIYQNIYGPEIGLNAFKNKVTSKLVTIKIK